MKTALFWLLLALTACTPDAPVALDTPIAVAEPTAPEQQIHQAKVIGVIDGDTLDVLLDGNTQQRLRLNGIDAPERGQPFGNNAKQVLSVLTMGKSIDFQALDTDRYNRTIAEIYVDGTRVTEVLVAAGLAWHYVKYSDDAELAVAEDTAQLQGIGVWSGTRFVAPWDWRKLSREERDRLR